MNKNLFSIASKYSQLSFWRVSLLVTIYGIGLLSILASGGGSEEAGGALEPANQSVSASGIWGGTITPTGGSTQVATVLITEDGSFSFLSDGNLSTDNMLVNGNASTTGSQLSASGLGYHSPNGTTFPNSSATATITFSGTAAAKTSITGNYSGGGAAGTFSFLTYRTAAYERAASLAIVAGVYQVITGVSGSMLLTSTDAVVTVSGSTITLSDSAGCVGNGTIAAPNASRNYYTWSLTLTSCGAVTLTGDRDYVGNGSYTGLAYLDADPLGTYNKLVMRGGSGTSLFAFAGAK